MKLYSLAPQDCGGKVRWLLHELGQEFEEIRLSYKNGDTKTESYLEKHPLGQVPVLEDGDIRLFESYAIISYLADKFPEKGLAPSLQDNAKRAEYLQWLFFSLDSVEKFIGKFQMLPKTNEEYRGQWGNYVEEKTQKVLATIDKRLKEQEYVLGSFSAVDTCLGYAIDAVIDEPLMTDYKATKDYYERLKSRPACIKSEVFKR